MAKPFIKWAGGKAYLIPTIAEMVEGLNMPYCEPMVGGGAIFFALKNQFTEHTISDVNTELINLYQVIKDKLPDLLSELSSGYEYVHKSDATSAANYHRIRSSRPTDTTLRAARILFLLKTCFNGLMRVNKSGHFNVPMGSYTNPKVMDKEVLQNASDSLQNVDIRLANVTATIESLTKPTFLFIDPPYHSEGNKFTNYSGEFTNQHQSDLIEQLAESEHKFIYTNRATDFIVNNIKKHKIEYKLVPLKHSIQPKYTTGKSESEIIAHRV